MEENRQSKENVEISSVVQPTLEQMKQSIVNGQLGAQILTDRDVKTDKDIELGIEEEIQPQKVDLKEPEDCVKESEGKEKESGSYKKIRSDDSEFQKWNAAVIKDGMFQFKEVQDLMCQSPERNKSKVMMSRNKSIEVEEPVQQAVKNSQSKNKVVNKVSLKKSPAKPENPLKRSSLKVSRTLGSHKKEIQVKTRDELPGQLASLKPLNKVFSHFCKENNFTSFKSTLFEDKPKLMEEMSLNKWMVFCKII